MFDCLYGFTIFVQNVLAPDKQAIIIKKEREADRIPLEISLTFRS